MTHPTLAPLVCDRPRVGHCQEHASARFRYLIPAAPRPDLGFRTSKPVNYVPSVRPASDGSIHRYYDPTTAQFLSVDPMVEATRQAYVYAGNDPVNYVDPSGEDAADIRHTPFRSGVPLCCGLLRPPLDR